MTLDVLNRILNILNIEYIINLKLKRNTGFSSHKIENEQINISVKRRISHKVVISNRERESNKL